VTDLSIDRRHTSPRVADEDARLAARPGARGRLGLGPRVPGMLALGPVLLLLAWLLGSATGALDPRTLSPPWTVVGAAGELIADGRLQSNLAASLYRAGTALLLGVGLGVLLALVAGLSRVGEALVDGPIQIKRAIPTVALIPLAILWFGIGEQMKIIVILAAVFVPIYLNTYAGLRNIDGRYVELAESLGLSRAQFIRRVALPGALPGFCTGLRLGVTMSWLVLAVVEQVNATSGIGYLMNQARTYGQTDIIVVGLVVYGIFGLVGDYLVRTVERRSLAWRRTLGD
jgi:sulfonate transport system permease protein